MGLTLALELSRRARLRHALVSYARIAAAVEAYVWCRGADMKTLVGSLGGVMLVILVAFALQPSSADQVTPSSAVPFDAITAILGAFKTHQNVALSDAHGNSNASRRTRPRSVVVK